MLGIGRYLLLFIVFSVLSLSVDGRFTRDDIKNFLDYIFRLHNAVRIKHGVPVLRRTHTMNVVASRKLSEFLANRNNYINQLGVIVRSMTYDNTTQLNVEEAMKFFSLSYEQGNFYDYSWNLNIFPTVIADEFTQIVWRSTTQIGLTFICQKNEYFVLTAYHSHGNIQDQYQYNILQPLGHLPAIDPNIPGLIYRTEKEKFLDNLFKLHNEKRRMHGVQDLIRDDHMDEQARTIPSHGTISPTEEYGLNWHAFGNIQFPLKSNDANGVFFNWYDRKEFYDYNIGLPSRTTDPFTQIVWENTRKIGLNVQYRMLGHADGQLNLTWEYLVIVVYEPPGNIPGQYTRKVRRPLNIIQGESSGTNS